MIISLVLRTEINEHFELSFTVKLNHLPGAMSYKCFEKLLQRALRE